MKIYIRLYRKNKVIKRYIGGRANWRKVYAKLASAVAEKYFIRVEYGKQMSVFGTKEMFFNEYEGDSVVDAKKAFKAFIE